MASAPAIDRRLDHDCPDDVLVERARARDVQAFGTLVCRHQPKLRRLVSRILDTTPDQDEALQNAFLSAWRHLPEFQGRSQFSSWMYRVTTNAAFMLLRYQGRRPHAPMMDVRASAEERGGQALLDGCGGGCWVRRPDEALQNAELRALLERNVAELPPILRDVFLLRYVDGLSIKEAAQALGVSEATTKTRLHRACLALRESIHRSRKEIETCRSRNASAAKAKGEGPAS